MKTAISIPDNVYQSAEQLASRLGESRSQLYTKALSSYVKKHQDDNVTNKLNEIYSDNDSTIHPALASFQNQTLLKHSEW